MFGRLATWFERATNLRPGEGRLALLGALQFFLLMFAYFMLRPLRDAMGLEEGVEKLSTLFFINAGVIAALSPVYGWLASRAVKRRLTVIVYRFTVLCLVVFALALWNSGGVASVLLGNVFYVWLSAVNMFIISLFWSLMADLQSPAQSKRVFGIVAVGGTLGTMAGSAWAWGLVEYLGAIGMMVCGAVLLECGARVSLLHGVEVVRGVRSRERIGGSAWAGLVDIATSPYLRAIGLYIVLYASVSTFLYFTKAGIVESAKDSVEDRAVLFAQIEFFGQMATVVLQLLLTGRALRRLGVGALMCIVPVVSVGGFVALALAPTVFTVTVFESIRRAAHHALGKPARETLYTVLPTEDKYKAKAALDTFVYRGGDAASALAYQGMAWASLPLLWLVVPMCAVAAGAAAWLGRQEKRREGETSAAQDGSRNGQVNAEPPIAD